MTLSKVLLGNLLRHQRVAARLTPAAAQIHTQDNDLLQRRLQENISQRRELTNWLTKLKVFGRSDYGPPTNIIPVKYDETMDPPHQRHTYDNPTGKEKGVPPQYDLRRSGLFTACALGDNLGNMLMAPINVHVPQFYKDRGQCVVIEPKHTRDHRVPPNYGFSNDTGRRIFVFLYYILFELILVYLYLLFDALLILFEFYWALSRIEIWLDRTGKNRRMPPWDWERCRENYTKTPQFWFRPIHSQKQGTNGPEEWIVPLNEALQDKMLEAARARGTR